MQWKLYTAKLPTVFKENIRIYWVQKSVEVGQRDPVAASGVQNLPMQTVKTPLLKDFFKMSCTKREFFSRDAYFRLNLWFFFFNMATFFKFFLTSAHLCHCVVRYGYNRVCCATTECLWGMQGQNFTSSNSPSSPLLALLHLGEEMPWKLQSPVAYPLARNEVRKTKLIPHIS